MRPTAIIVCTVLGVIGMVRAGTDKTSDLDRIQGSWDIVGLVEKGKKIPDEETKLIEIAVTGDRLVVKEKDKTVAEYKIKLDATQKPRVLDMTVTAGEDKNKTAPGIYVLEGDSFKIAMDEEFKQRPASFDEKDTKTCSVIALKRKAKK